MGNWESTRKLCVPILSLVFVAKEAFLSVAENFSGELEASSPHELSRSFTTDFKRSISRPRIIKINTFKLETL